MLGTFDVLNIIDKSRKLPTPPTPLSGRVIYVAGPMTGYEHWNFPAFDAAADQLIAAGDIVYSPTDMDRARGINEDTSPEDFPADAFAVAMQIDLTCIAAYCTHIYLLKGWSMSKGATIERQVAEATGKGILFAADAEGQNLVVA